MLLELKLREVQLNKFILIDIKIKIIFVSVFKKALFIWKEENY